MPAACSRPAARGGPRGLAEHAIRMCIGLQGPATGAAGISVYISSVLMPRASVRDLSQGVTTVQSSGPRGGPDLWFAQKSFHNSSGCSSRATG